MVLVGVSRTSKTPTSIYLANRGIKTANVPLVPGCRYCRRSRSSGRPLIVGLYASPERIVQIRENRMLGLRAHHDDDQYIDKTAVTEEMAYSRRLCPAQLADDRRQGPFDRETAAAVMRLLTERRGQGRRARICRFWLATAAAGARLAQRGARQAAGGGRPALRDPAGADRRARGGGAGGGGGRTRSRRRRPDPGAGQGAKRGGVGARTAGARRRSDAGAGQAALQQAGEPTEAAAQLRSLRGQSHALHSALALVRDGEVLFDHVDSARLTMRDFSDAFLDDYLDMRAITPWAASAAISWKASVYICSRG